MLPPLLPPPASASAGRCGVPPATITAPLLFAWAACSAAAMAAALRVNPARGRRPARPPGGSQGAAPTHPGAPPPPLGFSPRHPQPASTVFRLDPALLRRSRRAPRWAWACSSLRLRGQGASCSGSGWCPTAAARGPFLTLTHGRPHPPRPSFLTLPRARHVGPARRTSGDGRELGGVCGQGGEGGDGAGGAPPSLGVTTPALSLSLPLALTRCDASAAPPCSTWRTGLPTTTW